MKKLCITLALVFAFAAGGCAKQADGGDACQLVEEGKLLVALSPDFAPMEFVDTAKAGQEQYVGFDVTLAQYIASEMGLELVIKPMSFDACQTAVQLGAVDMSISGYSWTEARAENFNLSDYYYAGDNETEQTVIVPAGKAGTFLEPADFAGLTVAAQAASLQENLCNEQLAAHAAAIELFKSIDDAVLALKTGKVNAVAVAYGNAEAIIANNPDIGLAGFTFVIDEAAANNLILLKKGADALTQTVDGLLKKAYDAGYYGAWYEEAKLLSGIPSAADVSYDEEGKAQG